MNKQSRAKNLSTSPEQRKLLFQTWQETGEISTACDVADVSRSTFYYWKERFEEEGFKALKETRSHAPHKPNRIPEQLSSTIIKLKSANPAWGKKQIAQNILQNNRDLQSLSPNTVRRVLIDAGLW